MRVWDAYQTALPGTPATDDLGLVGGTFGSASPSLQTEDLGGESGNPTLNRARCVIAIPAEYASGQNAALRFRAGMLTTVADDHATLDCEVYLSDGEGGVGSDLVNVSAQDINSLTLTNFDFTLTSTSLAAGSILDVRITTSVSDAGDAGVMKAIIGAAYLLCDIRG